jgi:hypothetical protein
MLKRQYAAVLLIVAVAVTFGGAARAEDALTSTPIIILEKKPAETRFLRRPSARVQISGA